MTTKPLYEAQHLRTVRLYGKLGARFGRVHRLAVQSTAEAVRALCVLYDGFEAYMLSAKDQGVGFAVFLGKNNIEESQLTFRTQQDIRIAPVIMGSKNSGLVSIILGVALIAVSFFVPGGGLLAAGLFNAGVAMALGGIVQLLSPQPKDPKSQDDPDKTPNYAFNGPINTEAQGHCVPVAYGKPWTGSAVISAGIQADDVFIPATSVEANNVLLARGPEFYYPCNDGGTQLHDISGNNHAILNLSGGYSFGGGGVTFDDTGTGDAFAGGVGTGIEGVGESSAFVNAAFHHNPIGTGWIASLNTHSVLGFYSWAIFVIETSPGVSVFAVGANHQAGSGVQVYDSVPVALGTTYTVGFQIRGGNLELVKNGAIVGSAPCGTLSGGSGSFMLGEHFYDNTRNVTNSQLIGFTHAHAPADLPGLDADMRNPIIYSGSETGEGDDFWETVEEALTDD